MAFQYTQAELSSDIDGGLRGKIGMIANQTDFLNRVVREVHADVAIRSARRRQQLTPNLFPGIYDYGVFDDLYGNRIIDIPAQAKRHDSSFNLVPVEQFNVNPQLGDIALDDFNGGRTLKIKSNVSVDQSVIDPLDAVDDWVSFGDGENLERDGDDYIRGSGSISWDIDAAGGTTAGIKNTQIDSFDLTDYLGGYSSLFVWARINSTTNLTNYVLRIGTDESNYYSKTITADNAGNAFSSGWNLLRFDLTSLTETGTVTKTDIQYIALYMTKDASKVSETDYKFDHILISDGVIHNVLYYSQYFWQNSTTSAYQLASTDSADVLVADENEFPLFVKKGIAIGRDLTNFADNEIKNAMNDYVSAVQSYAPQNPDESQVMVSTYHNY